MHFAQRTAFAELQDVSPHLPAEVGSIIVQFAVWFPFGSPTLQFLYARLLPSAHLKIPSVSESDSPIHVSALIADARALYSSLAIVAKSPPVDRQKERAAVQVRSVEWNVKTLSGRVGDVTVCVCVYVCVCTYVCVHVCLREYDM